MSLALKFNKKRKAAKATAQPNKRLNNKHVSATENMGHPCIVILLKKLEKI